MEKGNNNLKRKVEREFIDLYKDKNRHFSRSNKVDPKIKTNMTSNFSSNLNSIKNPFR